VYIDWPSKGSVVGVTVRLPGVTAAVVLLKLPATPPMVSVVVTVLPGLAEAVCRTQTDCPGLMVAALLVKVPVQPIEYSPLLTEMGAAVL
jgi:hypothetical protein